MPKKGTKKAPPKAKQRNFLGAALAFKISNKLLEDWQRIVNERPTMEEIAVQMSILYECDVTGANIITCAKAIEKEWPRRRSPMAADAALEVTAAQVAALCEKAKVTLIPEFAAMLKS